MHDEVYTLIISYFLNWRIWHLVHTNGNSLIKKFIDPEMAVFMLQCCLPVCHSQISTFLVCLTSHNLFLQFVCKQPSLCKYLLSTLTLKGCETLHLLKAIFQQRWQVSLCNHRPRAYVCLCMCARCLQLTLCKHSGNLGWHCGAVLSRPVEDRALRMTFSRSCLFE